MFIVGPKNILKCFAKVLDTGSLNMTMLFDMPLKYLEAFSIEPIDARHPLVILKNDFGSSSGSRDSIV